MKLKIGTPLWKKASEPIPVLPAATTAAHNVFVGCTIRDKEESSGEFKVASTGRFLARVHGPVSVGDTLVQAPGYPYLVAGSGAQNGVGTAEGSADTMDDINASTLIPMTRGGGGGSGGIRFRGQWSATEQYAEKDVVIRALDAEIDDGNLVGTFIANTPTPDGSQPQDVPKYPLNTPASSWDLVAIFPNERLVMRGGEGDRDQTIELDAGKSPNAASLPKFIMTANREDVEEGPRLDLDMTLFYGKIIKPQELRVCEIDPETGVKTNGYRMFVVSDFYTTPVTPED